MPPRYSEDQYRELLIRSRVPEHMHDGYVMYLLHGVPPGHFLEAVLINDLREACGRADDANRRALYEHVFFLYNHAPGNAWGSPERVNEWLESFAVARRIAEVG